MGGLVGSLEGLLAKWQGEILGATRIICAFMFMQHGTQKMFGFPVAMMHEWDLMTLNPGLAGVMEVVAGPLLLVGLFTRPVAFLCSGLTAVAYFMVHAPLGFWTRANGGEAAVFYAFFFLYLAAAGGGKWSLDDMLDKGKA